MATQIILLERVDNLGEMGDVVSVKPGYARNFLLPQKKALRASKDNVAYFEAQKKHIQAESDKLKKEADKQAEKLKGLKVSIIRQASESGQLFGSVTSRDIADAVKESSKTEVNRTQVILNQNYKTLGLFEVEVTLHPEVKVPVTINIARTVEEAEIQAETGKALVSDASEEATLEEIKEEAIEEAQLEDVLEESALEAEKEKRAAAEEEAKAKAEAAAKAAEEQAEAEAAESDAEETAEDGAAEEQAEAPEDDAKE